MSPPLNPNPTLNVIRDRKYRTRNRERINEGQRLWVTKNKDKIKMINARQYKKTDFSKRAQYAREEKRRLRHQVLEAYGGKCECCGDTAHEFLTIDHINGGGSAHKKAVGGSGTSVYRWLRQQGFPKDGFRLLCFNCNRSYGAYGYCPHQKRSGGEGRCTALVSHGGG